MLKKSSFGLLLWRGDFSIITSGVISMGTFSGRFVLVGFYRYLWF